MIGWLASMFGVWFATIAIATALLAIGWLAVGLWFARQIDTRFYSKVADVFSTFIAGMAWPFAILLAIYDYDAARLDRWLGSSARK